MPERFRAIAARRGEEPVDDLGIPWRIHAYVFLTAILIVSLGSLLIAFTPSGYYMRDTPTLTMIFIGLAIGIAQVFLQRRWRYRLRPWYVHLLFVYALVTFIVSPIASGGQISAAFAIKYLPVTVGAAYYLPFRQALPHLILIVSSVAFFANVTQEPSDALRMVLLAHVIAATAVITLSLRRHLARIVQANRRLSERDPLTGLANLRSYERSIAMAIDRHDRDGRGFRLVALDLDDFKRTNDTLSHSVGDRVLVASADAIRRWLAADDLAVRRGGDEFLILAPDEPEREIATTIEHIRDAIVTERRRLCPKVIPTVSIAFVAHDAGECASSLMSRVDAALHRVKSIAPSTRRNTVNSGDLARIIKKADTRPVVDPSAKPKRGLCGLNDAEREPFTDAVLARPADELYAGFRTAWRVCAASSFGVAATLVAFVKAGHDAVRPTPAIFAIIVVNAVVLAPMCLHISVRGKRSTQARIALAGGSLPLVTLACFSLGGAAEQATELFLLPTIVMAAIAPARISFGYAAAAFALYGAFVIGSGENNAVTRVQNTVLYTSFAVGVFGILRARSLAAAQLSRDLASIDPLTGLPNLRRLRSRVADEIRRCERTESRCGVLMLDLDDFKRVNDEFGHTTGDHVLRTVADAIAGVVRRSEMPARRGGDEFAIVVPNVDPWEMQTIATRLGDEIAKVRRAVCPSIVSSAGIGTAIWRPGESADELLERVDRALHDEKYAAHERSALVDVAEMNGRAS